jgi:hypothetical protein
MFFEFIKNKRILVAWPTFVVYDVGCSYSLIMKRVKRMDRLKFASLGL